MRCEDLFNTPPITPTIGKPKINSQKRRGAVCYHSDPCGSLSSFFSVSESMCLGRLKVTLCLYVTGRMSECRRRKSYENVTQQGHE